MLELNKIYLGDCFELMKEIPDKSVDCILTDPPYGITACEWKELKRNFIAIEKDENYYNISLNRMEEHFKQQEIL